MMAVSQKRGEGGGGPEPIPPLGSSSSPLRIRVSWLDAFQHYLNGEYGLETAEDLEERMRSRDVTPAMEVGIEFHSALEMWLTSDNPEETKVLNSPAGGKFRFEKEAGVLITPGGETEVLLERNIDTLSGPVILQGHADYIDNYNVSLVTEEYYENTGLLLYREYAHVYEWKTTHRAVSIDKYQDSWQWRGYLSMVDAHTLTYCIFRLAETDDKREHVVTEVHEFSQYPYKGMREEVDEHVGELAKFMVDRGIEGMPEP